jgi:cytoskeleton protein RodZ
VGEGLNAPFRERPGNPHPRDWSSLASPAVWGPALVLLAAALVYLLPSGWFKMPQLGSRAGSAPIGAASSVAAVSAGEAASTVVETFIPPPELAASAAGPSTPSVAGILQVRSSAESWLEVLDGRGRTLVSRMVQPGEAVGLDGATPLKVRIGNAAVTQVVFRGKEMELSSFTRDNVARLELK